jgi:hypothetical protein
MSKHLARETINTKIQEHAAKALAILNGDPGYGTGQHRGTVTQVEA